MDVVRQHCIVHAGALTVGIYSVLQGGEYGEKHIHAVYHNKVLITLVESELDEFKECFEAMLHGKSAWWSNSLYFKKHVETIEKDGEPYESILYVVERGDIVIGVLGPQACQMILTLSERHV